MGSRPGGFLHCGVTPMGQKLLCQYTRAEIFRRMEILFGLVPSFLKRLDDAGAILGRFAAPKDDGRTGVGKHGPPGGSVGGRVVCRYGPNEVRRPVGGDQPD